MRKIVGAISAVALVSVAILTSKTIFVTQAVGMGVEGGVGAQSAAARIAHRFPTSAELFRDFIKPATDADRAAALSQKGDRQPIAGTACGNPFSPVPTTDCLAAGGKPVQPSGAVPVAERRPATGVSASRATTIAPEPVRTHVAAAVPVAAAAPLAAATPVRAAAAVPPPSCAHTLATANVRVERVLARIKDTRARQGTDACATYRNDFFAVVQAREVTALCKTGAERERDLSRIDGAVEDINSAIAVTCGT
jgi:hypothetical protein